MTTPGRRTRRFRLVDGVVVAAGALLLLKVASFLATPSEPDLAPDGLPRFGHVIGHARSNYRPADPDVTGSVSGKAPPEVAPPGAAEAPSVPSEPGRDVSAETPKGSPSERAIRERLGERREELQQRSRDLETREKLLEEAERRAEARAEERRRAEQGTVRAEVEKEAEPLKGLVVMYEAMKPKDAARVFDRLPQDVLVPIVRRIAPRKMAEILGAMSPDVAQKLTTALARPAGAAEASPVAALPPGELPAIEPPPKAGARPN
ncbi:MotE family protein [Enterovirga rhinocerotis]|uniref:Flagellar motility protein MotE (MotC chaperone) n=1 Tax=Enterovirga rhinocerotis TaxID=1339210 RepID=A0A4V3DXM6_9HYPH|nr:hypothetical protein [Enterovirga rhinocerotis]TDR88909.1 flagellar motility protein MotE (MotC chaperone) [Enterovirga rhinocerotis]